MIEKILEKFRELGNIQFASYTKPLIAVEDAIKIVQEVAKEYDAFDVIRKRVHELELQYSESGDIENVKRCTSLQNYLRYFKEQLKAPYQKGE